MDVFINSNLPEQSQKLKKFLNPKVIFIILGIVVLVEIVYAVKVLTSPVAPPPSRATQAVSASSGGAITLNSAKTTYKVKEPVSVSVDISTGGKRIGGGDVIIRFDPKVLEATPAGLVTGQVFGEYPLKSVDPKAGVIAISGISSSEEGFSGSGQFAIVNFRAKAAGTTPLTIEYQKDSTTDSNLVEISTSQDILENIRNLQLTIQ
ncbi:hypothetical protein HYS95_00410 [Candidatus Daviesbacteria bacterium]|nr:hypothetical protein [Candidatus Daviesbacteria bacterium]